MNNAGRTFREARERLKLTYREVEEASLNVANAKLNSDFYIPISRLSEIENNNALPSVYRLYSLCVIYRISVCEALRWYGIDLTLFVEESARFSSGKTQVVADSCDESRTARIPVRLDPGFDVKRTGFLSRMIQAWGTMPLALLERVERQQYRYGYIGEDDWMMYPLIMPGSFVQIDTQRRKVESEGWRNEFERPVYFMETRQGYCCCWLMELESGHLLLQPYTLSPCKAAVQVVPDEAELVGQVIGVAMHLTAAKSGKFLPPSAPRGAPGRR